MNPMHDLLRTLRTRFLRVSAALPLIDRQQIAFALADRDGRVAAADNPLRLAALQHTGDHIRAAFDGELDGDDVVMTNDPFSGGTRIQDVTLLRPLERAGQRIGYVLATTPLPDLGGMALGGTYPYALEIWAEGVRVTPVRLFRKGALQNDALTMLTLNSRLAKMVELDVLALAESLDEAADHARSHSSLDGETLPSAVDAAGEAFGARLAELPERELRARGPTIHQCLDPEPLFVEVAAKVREGRIKLDFAGTSPASRGFVNATLSATWCGVAAALAGVVPRVHANAGLLSRVELAVPEGGLLDAKLPRSVGGSIHSVVDAVARAVSGAMAAGGLESPVSTTARPERVFRTPGCGLAGCPFD